MAPPGEITQREAVVVGGGIAGLAAAHVLAERGVPFVLLEASRRLGGVIRSESRDGFLMEAGPDTLLAQKPAGTRLCRAVGLGERLVPTNLDQRRVYAVKGGRLCPVPEGMALGIPTRLAPLIATRLFSWPDKMRMALDLIRPPRRSTDDESIAAFLRRRLGQKVVDLIGDPLLAGIHSGDAERLSIRATFPRFVDYERRYGSLIRGFLAARPTSSFGPKPVPFYSLVGGLEELVTGLVARLPQDALRLGCAAQGLEGTPGDFRIQSGSGQVFRARVVILAVPVDRAAALLGTLLPEAARLLGEIPFVSTAAVYLGYRRDQVRHPLDGYGAVIPRSAGLRTAAMSFFSVKFPGRAPEGQVLLRAFLGGAHDPDILTLDDDSLVAIVRTELGALLGIEGAPSLTQVYRWPSAMPQMEVGHPKRVDAIELEEASLPPGLYLCSAGLRYTGIPDAIADATRAGQAAAELLNGGAAPAPERR